MAPRYLHQQPLYLEPADAETLDKLSAETSKQKQVLLREAVKDLFVKYRSQGFLKPDLHRMPPAEMLTTVAREIRAAASVDVEKLVADGELIQRSNGWYEVVKVSALAKVGLLISSIKEFKAKDGTVSGTWVRLASRKKYKEMAARLRDNV
jgi:hypothetical protein